MTGKRFSHFSFITGLSASLAVPGLLSQSAGTGVSGTIVDPSGAAVPHVTVTLTNTDANQARSLSVINLKVTPNSY